MTFFLDHHGLAATGLLFSCLSLGISFGLISRRISVLILCGAGFLAVILTSVILL